MRKREFHRLLALLRGARRLQKKGDPFFVVNTVSALAEVSLGLKVDDFPTSLVGAHSSKAEILLRQTFLHQYSKLCASIMRGIGSNASLSMPLPSTWVKQLSSQGVSCSPMLCRISLVLSAIKKTAQGSFKFALLLLQLRNPKAPDHAYVAFLGLQQNNLPVSDAKRSYDIISWYRSSKFRERGIKKILAQTGVEPSYPVPQDVFLSRSAFPVAGSLKRYLTFLLSGIRVVFISIVGVSRGKWWYGYLTPEAIDLCYLKALNKEHLAEEYFFNNSNWYFKPLWTYEAEDNGIPVTLYYYSTNIEIFTDSAYQINDAYGLSTMTWNRFIVWDEQQREYLKRFRPAADYDLAGIIDFADTPITLEKLDPGFNIAIFDVTPTRPIATASLGMATPFYYSEHLCLQFFIDIGSIGFYQGVNLLWKKKRAVGSNFVSARYLKKQSIVTNSYFRAIDTRVSARRLLERCDAVISMPFSSAALIGKNIGLPSVYYDPLGQLQIAESHGILVLKGTEQLRDWLKINTVKTINPNIK